jgi:hypothetical protein
MALVKVLSEDFYDYFSVADGDKAIPHFLNKELDKEIEEAEREVEAEEANESPPQESLKKEVEE